MKRDVQQDQKKWPALTPSLDAKLASYLAASASIGVVMASEAKAIVVSNGTVQPVGINGFANIDFNSDGQVDFQIDHDRVDLGGGNVVDYLQLDKNDVNGASPGENLFTTNFLIPFPENGTVANDTANSAYAVENSGSDFSFEYPSALLAGAEIGQPTFFDIQEGDNVRGTTKTGRFNRLIDEDQGQAQVALGGLPPDKVLAATNTPQFLGLGGQVRYLGVKMDLNNTNAPPEGQPEAADGFNYGWIGVRITNEADATAEVVGYGYETTPGASINAGATGILAGDYDNNGKVDTADYIVWRNSGTLQNETVTPGSPTPEDFNVWRASYGNIVSPPLVGGAGTVPEPASSLLSLIAGLGLALAYFCRRVRGR